MVKVTDVVKLDKFGKIFIPKEIRDKIGATEFEIIVEEDHLELIPVRNPIELFGTLKKIDRKKLDEIHGEDHEFAS